MSLFFRSRKKEKLKRLENKLFMLVEKKEGKEQIIDDYGRDLVLALRDYLHDQTNVKYRILKKEAIEYIKLNDSNY